MRLQILVRYFVVLPARNVPSQRCQTFLLANWMQPVNMLLHQEHILKQPISSDASRTELLSWEPSFPLAVGSFQLFQLPPSLLFYLGFLCVLLQ